MKSINEKQINAYLESALEAYWYLNENYLKTSEKTIHEIQSEKIVFSINKLKEFEPKPLIKNTIKTKEIIPREFDVNPQYASLTNLINTEIGVYKSLQKQFSKHLEYAQEMLTKKPIGSYSLLVQAPGIETAFKELRKGIAGGNVVETAAQVGRIRKHTKWNCHVNIEETANFAHNTQKALSKALFMTEGHTDLSVKTNKTLIKSLNLGKKLLSDYWLNNFYKGPLSNTVIALDLIRCYGGKE